MATIPPGTRPAVLLAALALAACLTAGCATLRPDTAPPAEPTTTQDEAKDGAPPRDGDVTPAGATSASGPAARAEGRAGGGAGTTAGGNRGAAAPGTGTEPEASPEGRPRSGSHLTNVADRSEQEYPSPDLLMKALGLEGSSTRVFGFVQGEFTANPSVSNDRQNFGVHPNNLANAWSLQQVYLIVENPIRQEDRLNFGYRVDQLLGNDWQNLHSTGLFDNAWPLDHPGYDLVQVYGEVHLPVLTKGGIDVKGGRFFSLTGYENGPAVERPLLSTSYLDYYADPFTFFGVMSTWHVTDRVNVYNGVVNGWDRWVNATYKWGYAGGASWFSRDGRTEATVTVAAGPGQFPRFPPTGLVPFPTGSVPVLPGRRFLGYGRDNRTLVNLVVGHEWNARLTSVVALYLGHEDAVPGLGPGGTGPPATWGGVAHWLFEDITDRLTAVYRAEFFRDGGGSRTGVSDTFYEMTLGLVYRPRDWLWVRPEVRGDWAASGHPYNEGRSGSQLTFGFDTILLF